jgi:hypothetical protein
LVYNTKISDNNAESGKVPRMLAAFPRLRIKLIKLIKSVLKSKLNGNNLIKAVSYICCSIADLFFWCYKTNLHHPKSAIERFNLHENGGRGFSNLEILQHNQIASLKNYFLNRARGHTFFNALLSADKGYTPLNLNNYSIHLSFVKNGPIKTQFYTFVTMVSKNWTEYSHSWKLYR